MNAIGTVGSGATAGNFDVSLPPEVQLVIILLSLACAAWFLSFALPPGLHWRGLWMALRGRIMRKRPAGFMRTSIH